jgi:hypothetical protein
MVCSVAMTEFGQKRTSFSRWETVSTPQTIRPALEKALKNSHSEVSDSIRALEGLPRWFLVLT